MTDLTHYEFTVYENLFQLSTVAVSAPWSIVSQNVRGNEIVRPVWVHSLTTYHSHL